MRVCDECAPNEPDEFVVKLANGCGATLGKSIRALRLNDLGLCGMCEKRIEREEE